MKKITLISPCEKFQLRISEDLLLFFCAETLKDIPEYDKAKEDELPEVCFPLEDCLEFLRFSFAFSSAELSEK